MPPILGLKAPYSEVRTHSTASPHSTVGEAVSTVSEGVSTLSEAISTLGEALSTLGEAVSTLGEAAAPSAKLNSA